MDNMENPPAFPNTGNSAWSMPPTEGMTLRDWFAGQALIGIMTGHDSSRGQFGVDGPANTAYHIADQMLAARLGAPA